MWEITLFTTYMSIPLFLFTNGVKKRGYLRIHMRIVIDACFIYGLMFLARFGPVLSKNLLTPLECLADFYVLFSFTKCSGYGVQFRFLWITEFKSFHVPFVSLCCFSSKLLQYSFPAYCKIFVNLFLFFYIHSRHLFYI